MTAALVGSKTLLRVSIKHGRKSFAPWIVIVTVLSVSSVIVYPWLFTEEADRQAFAAAIGSNPALGLVFGPAFDLLSDDGFNAWRSLSLGGFAVGLGSVLTLTALTRGQEDSGKAELLESGVLGRGSRLFAAIGAAAIGSLAAGVVSALLTVLFGGGWAATVLLSATFTVTGWVFASIAAVTAQLGAEARSSNSLAIGILGSLFVMRGFTYSIDAPSWAIWVNPLSWMTETRPASGNNWLPLLYGIVLVIVMVAVAYTLQSRRDFGQGALSPRPGRARGSVRSTSALAWRLNRGTIVSWTLAFMILGIVFGLFTASVHDVLRKDSAVTTLLAAGATTPGELVGAFMVMIFSLLGIIATIPGIQIMTKVRREELDDRVEPILAGTVHRARYLVSSVTLAFLAPAALLVLSGTILAVLAGRADIGIQTGDAVLQAAATVPAVWTVVALSVAVVGARPRLMLVAWAGTVLSFGLTVLGPTFKLWTWMLALSPFWHVPGVSAQDPDWLGLGWISLVTAVFLVMGFKGFRSRDLAV